MLLPISPPKTRVERMLFLMAHAISQLVRRWLPPPSVAVDSEEVSDPMEAWPTSVDFWRDLFLWWCETRWAPEYLATYRRCQDPGGAVVANAIARHLEGMMRAGGRMIFLGDAEY